MKRSDFSYELPDELIARYPADQRSQSRMLQLDGASGEVCHGVFTDIADLLHAGDLLVINNTRVIPARVFGRKESGGRLEILVERVLNEHHVLAHVRASKSPKADSFIVLTDSGGQHAICLKVLGRRGELFELAFPQNRPVSELLNEIGHMPLPPYIDRVDEQCDRERYQTVYGSKPGAVAAPTAGLHFDEAILLRLQEKGVETASVTLHVGAGTFQPVRADNILEHTMHAEYLEVDEDVCRKVKLTRERGGRVVAVGTTAVRSLETASASGELRPFRGDSDIFIYPGYRFRSVDALLTNFHLPESTLIMLVSAFAGRENVLSAYAEAIKHGYRFFSYGDCMFVTPQRSSSTESRFD